MDIGTLFSTILFIGPGFLIRTIEDEFFTNSNRFDNNEKHVVKAFFDSFIILLVNMFFLKILFKYNFYSFNYFVSKFDTIIFFIKYVILTFITSFIYVFLKRLANFISRIIKNCLGKITLSLLKTMKEMEYKIYEFFKLEIIETSYPTIWESIISDSEGLIGKIITIERDNVLISCGYQGEVTRINTDTKEIKLTNTKEIKSYMLDKEFLKNYIGTIDFEYFDFETGTLLKCYTPIENAFEKFNRRNESVLQANEWEKMPFLIH